MNQDLKDLIKKAYDTTSNEPVIVSVSLSFPDLLKSVVKNKCEDGTMDLREFLDIVDNEIDDKDIMYSSRFDFNLRHHLLDYFDLENGCIVEAKDGKYNKTYIPDMDHFRFVNMWKSIDVEKRVIITHDKCLDGFGVELAALESVPVSLRDSVIILRLDYNNYNIDELYYIVENAVVYVGDFSFELDELNKLKEVCNICVVDHHEKPFNKATSEYTNCIFDMTKSGAMLTWMFFHNDHTMDCVPVLLELINDRDVWNWFHDETYVKATSVFLGSYLGEKDGSKRFLKEHTLLLDPNHHHYAKEHLDSLLAPYIYAVKADDKRISDTITKYQLDCCKINNVSFLAINYSDVTTRSELLNKLSTMFSMPAFSWTIKNNILALSLRSTSDDVNVNELANPFGGGGHPRASGINVDISDIDLPLFFGLGNHRELKLREMQNEK